MLLDAAFKISPNSYTRIAWASKQLRQRGRGGVSASASVASAPNMAVPKSGCQPLRLRLSAWRRS